MFQHTSGKMTYASSGKKTYKPFLKYSVCRWTRTYIYGEFENDSKNNKDFAAF